MSSITAYEFYEIDINGKKYTYGSRSVGNTLALDSSAPDIYHSRVAVATTKEVKVVSLGSTSDGSTPDDMSDFSYALFRPDKDVFLAWAPSTDSGNSVIKLRANHWFKFTMDITKTYSATTEARVSDAVDDASDITSIWLGFVGTGTAYVDVILVR